MVEILSILLVVSLAVYALEMLFLRMGITRASAVPKTAGYEPTVSIIVAARNEEEFIAQCIESLSRLDYPQEKLEVIIVNDRSTDCTADIITEAIRALPYMKTIPTEKEHGNLRGKTNAVAAGIEHSSGEILFFTDADCTVAPSWVKETVQYYANGTGIVGGFTLLNATRQFEGMQALDWLLLFGVSSSTAGWNIPLTVIGNNFSIRREAYDATGGYEKIPFSVTEDYALVRAVMEQGTYNIRFPLSEKTLVRSNACSSWSQLFRQKQRWGVGGLDMVTRGFLLTALGWFSKLVLLVSLFFISPALWIGSFSAKALIDLMFLSKPLKSLRAGSYLKYLPAFSVYYLLYVLVIPFVAVLSKKVVWKERSH